MGIQAKEGGRNGRSRIRMRGTGRKKVVYHEIECQRYFGNATACLRLRTNAYSPHYRRIGLLFPSDEDMTWDLHPYVVSCQAA